MGVCCQFTAARLNAGWQETIRDILEGLDCHLNYNPQTCEPTGDGQRHRISAGTGPKGIGEVVCRLPGTVSQYRTKGMVQCRAGLLPLTMPLERLWHHDLPKIPHPARSTSSLKGQSALHHPGGASHISHVISLMRTTEGLTRTNPCYTLHQMCGLWLCGQTPRPPWWSHVCAGLRRG